MVLMFGGNGRRVYMVAAMEVVVLSGDGVWWWEWICNSTNDQKRYKEVRKQQIQFQAEGL
jgi:hypothetical protein